MKFIALPLVALLVLFQSCQPTSTADLLVYNAKIYTVDDSFSVVEAMVIKDGKIIATGTKENLAQQYTCMDSLDAKGKFIYPGFIDAHAHFVGYATGLLTVDLTGTQSWEEILEKLKTFANENPEGWIVGRGWDQNDWQNKAYPTNRDLNQLFPDRPVLLTRIDGHAAIANQSALAEAAIDYKKSITGGEVVVANGEPTGLLIDNAVDLVSKHIPALSDQVFKKAILKAQENCLAVGLTTIDDCGLDGVTIDKIKKLQEEGDVKLRIYAMLSDHPDNYRYAEKNGILISDLLTVRSFKVYGDGALGSRGACLLQPYHDQQEHYGFLLSNPAHFDSVANWCLSKGWQMNTHAIGDSGNRVILNTYAKYLSQKPTEDLRWRIEHAQVVNTTDLALFGQHKIIPSVQPTHATSDMYWAEDRLGKERIASAYSYKQLLEQNRWIPLGTDFPVEDISPFKTFCAAVFRKDIKGWPENGFQSENALTREEALRGMTIWAARSNFEETQKGSLEKGKWADFVILDTDLMNAPMEDCYKAKALYTFINGKELFNAKK